MKRYYIRCKCTREAIECQKKLFKLGFGWNRCSKEFEFFIPHSTRFLLIADILDKIITWTVTCDGRTTVYDVTNCPLFKKNTIGFNLE